MRSTISEGMVTVRGPQSHERYVDVLADLRDRITTTEEEIVVLERSLAEKKSCKEQLEAELATQTEIMLGETLSEHTSWTPHDDPEYARKFEWSNQLLHTLKHVFGHDSFLGQQEQICNAALDRRDLIVITATGSGKSLTYQLPAMIFPGTSLVICPTRSLIRDQVRRVGEFKGVRVVSVTGDLTQIQQNEIFSDLERSLRSNRNQDRIHLCYTTPEASLSRRFTGLLQSMYERNKLDRIIIDEAHCMLDSDHNFRSDYQKLGKLRDLLQEVPIQILSATCTIQDCQAIMRRMGMRLKTPRNPSGTIIYRGSSYRSNLHYSVIPTPERSKLLDIISAFILNNYNNQCGIVYCMKRDETRDVAEHLFKHGISATYFHGDLPKHQRNKAQEEWYSNKVQVICATNAFGLGIDKADVRFVIHHKMSVSGHTGEIAYMASHHQNLQKTLDAYCQESGRAGRDGKDAACVLYTRPQDAFNLMAMGREERKAGARAMLRYAFSDSCLAASMSRYFQDSTLQTRNCMHCSHCTRLPGTMVKKDFTHDAWRIIRVCMILKDLDVAPQSVSRLTELCRSVGEKRVTRDVKGTIAGIEYYFDVCKQIPEGKVTLNSPDTKWLIVKLVELGYLDVLRREKDDKYLNRRVYVLIRPGIKAEFLHSLPFEQLKTGMITFSVPAPLKVQQRIHQEMDEIAAASPVYESAGPDSETSEDELAMPPIKPRLPRSHNSQRSGTSGSALSSARSRRRKTSSLDPDAMSEEIEPDAMEEDQVSPPVAGPSNRQQERSVFSGYGSPRMTPSSCTLHDTQEMNHERGVDDEDDETYIDDSDDIIEEFSSDAVDDSDSGQGKESQDSTLEETGTRRRNEEVDEEEGATSPESLPPTEEDVRPRRRSIEIDMEVDEQSASDSLPRPFLATPSSLPVRMPTSFIGDRTKRRSSAPSHWNAPSPLAQKTRHRPVVNSTLPLRRGPTPPHRKRLSGSERSSHYDLPCKCLEDTQQRGYDGDEDEDPDDVNTESRAVVEDEEEELLMSISLPASPQVQQPPSPSPLPSPLPQRAPPDHEDESPPVVDEPHLPQYASPASSRHPAAAIAVVSKDVDDSHASSSFSGIEIMEPPSPSPLPPRPLRSPTSPPVSRYGTRSAVTAERIWKMEKLSGHSRYTALSSDLQMCSSRSDQLGSTCSRTTSLSSKGQKRRHDSSPSPVSSEKPGPSKRKRGPRVDGRPSPYKAGSSKLSQPAALPTPPSRSMTTGRFITKKKRASQLVLLQPDEHEVIDLVSADEFDIIPSSSRSSPPS